MKITKTTIGDALKSLPALKRVSTNILGVDEVLGGGLVEGSVSLLAGQPGCGATTLLLQVADTCERRVLYATMERNIGDKVRRLGICSEDVRLIVGEVSVDKIIRAAIGMEAEILIVDPLQALCAHDGIAGSLRQVGVAVNALIRFAAKQKVAVIARSNVTKGGDPAVPRSVEHDVDAIFYLHAYDGDADCWGLCAGMEVGNGDHLCVLVGDKNRFGSSDAKSLLKLYDTGFEAVPRKSKTHFSGGGREKAKA